MGQLGEHLCIVYSMEQTKTSPLGRISSVKDKWNRSRSAGARNEETAKNCNTEFDFVNFDSSLMSTSVELDSGGDLRLKIVENLHQTTETRRGNLWLMSGRFLGRWREQFFVLTKNSIYFFSGSSGLASSRKINKLMLTDICDVIMVREKGQMLLSLEINKLKRILLRKEEGIRGWYEDILNNISALKAKNYRRCNSVDIQSRPKRPLMSCAAELVIAEAPAGFCNTSVFLYFIYTYISDFV